MEKKHVIMDDAAVSRAVARISYEIIERNKGVENICVVGIISRGAPIGRRIADKLGELEHADVPFGTLDITPYRDDVSETTGDEATDIPFSVTDKNVIIVDDVIFTGRSVRAAIDAIIKRGRPRSIQLAVLIDRGHRELPIRPDYVGKNLPTSHSEKVKVSVTELDGCDSVAIYG
ncbi:pyrimidine operon attenuation protein / uracil phosphoribosyltransferase [Ruminococcus sp. YRD2003]|uniref:bifunctional pyr operon transcriptional regulator/uracil phosphoribosyltransferase PyrR n=1 Tax=Ruminococcus sp. YRD2003 TaxID=1452313 RepID=UPI0008BCBD60|nr:bifunctional pyr operon transcriptional regulator/uracil phosphoribosyltransferase PyrR [Ruminococcus sp.]SEK28308.1 pyrimidine operon attenuation protein / uracil phosphoribosyltransferase [Ruminococcus flavefaciens]